MFKLISYEILVSEERKPTNNFMFEMVTKQEEISDESFFISVNIHTVDTKRFKRCLFPVIQEGENILHSMSYITYVWEEVKKRKSEITIDKNKTKL